MGNKTGLVKKYQYFVLGLFLFIFIFFIYVISSAGYTAFNHFTLLADAFLKGHLYIEGIAPWLEKIPISETRFFVANPPMPAILAMPLVLFFGKSIPQDYLAYFFGAALGVITFSLSLIVSKNRKLAIWSTLLISFGTINWYLASVGSTWYLAHIISQFFLTAAIFFTLKNKNPFLVGLLIGFSYLTRIPTILAFPFFLIMYFEKRNFIQNYLLLFLGVLPSIAFNAIYNYLRFGVVWDIGYTLIPGVVTEPWYSKGVVNLSYIPEHLKIIFLSFPNFNFNSINNFSFLAEKPSLGGYAIWFTTPAFIFALFNKFKDKIVYSSWLGILLISLLIFSHGSTGFSQFGYRFACDFYPLLTLITIKGVSKQNGPKWIHWTLLALGVLFNFWGVYSLNKIN